MDHDKLTIEDMREISAQSIPKSVVFTFPVGIPQANRDERIGWCLYIGALMKQRHPELHFDRLKAIAFTEDTAKTVRDLEQELGRALPAARADCEALTLFHVDVGQSNVLIVRDDWFDCLARESIERSEAVWQFAALLSTLDLSFRVKDKFSRDPWLAATAPYGFKTYEFGRDMLSAYWRGYFAYLPGYETTEMFTTLAEVIVEEFVLIEAVIKQFEEDSDVEDYKKSLQQSAFFICQAMAVVIGHSDATEKGLVVICPQLSAMIGRQNLDQLWTDLSGAITNLFRVRKDWSSAKQFLDVGQVGWTLLELFGIQHVLKDGQVIPIFVPPVNRALH